MACSHRADCPLFPNLKSSLSGWRTHYCDTEDAWMDCARYTRSVAGKPVPVSLLPNGKLAQVLDGAKGAKGGAAAAAARGGGGSVNGGVILAERSPTQPAKRSWWARLFGSAKAAS